MNIKGNNLKKLAYKSLKSKNINLITDSIKNPKDFSIRYDSFAHKEDSIEFIGITKIDRTPLYYNNKGHEYLLELTNNLDFIVTSILGGTLDKMSLIYDDNLMKKCQFYNKDEIIYILYGLFSDKRGNWILEMIEKFYSNLIKHDDLFELSNIKIRELKKKFELIEDFIIHDSSKIEKYNCKDNLPYENNNLRIDYIGFSSQSIGLISLLIGNELKIEIPKDLKNTEDELEMSESILTAKIEAIRANVFGNTYAIPRWISAKIHDLEYRFLSFKKYPNDYCLYFLSEGNLEKINEIENQLDELILPVTKKKFDGNMGLFYELKEKFREFFKKSRIF